MVTVLLTILDNSITFCLPFAAVWLVKTALRKHLSARLHYAIWVAVLVSLLIPVKIESGINLWSLLPRQTAETITLQVEHLQPSNEAVNGSNAGDGQGIQPHDQPTTASNVPDNPTVVSGNSQPARDATWNPMAHIDWPTLLGAVWLAGMAAAVLWLFLGGLRLRRQILRCGNPDTPAWLQACARQCAKALHMRQNVRIIVQPVLAMPAVMGIFHPILAMPESVLLEGDEECVRHILMHEFSHVKRGDLIVIAVLNVLSAIYWFNPLVWLCFNLIRTDMETCCDNDVINALGNSRRQEYIRTLVHFAGLGQHTRAQAALSLHDARIRMKKRIAAMYLIKKTNSAIAAPVILLVVILLLAASVTGCLPVIDKNTAWPGPSAAATLVTMPPVSDAPSAEPLATEPSAKPGATPAATASATAKPVETVAPAASQWESKYKPVLDQYRQFATDIKKYAGQGNMPDWKEPWGQIAPDVMLSTREFGYAFRDMDKNGAPELFLLTSDGSIWAMYTLADGTPTLLDTYWSRKACVLNQSDVIYMSWSDGALDNGQDAYKIAKDGRKLELIERVAMESTDESGNPLDEPRYYQCEGSQSNKKIISKAEAEKETSKFPKNNAKSGLEFTPLA